MALLGWNPGTEQEIFSMDELIKAFDLDRTSKSGAKFDYQKGVWFNHQYIQLKSDKEIGELFNKVLKSKNISAPIEKVITIAGLMKNRVSFVSELWEQCDFFFVAPTHYDEKTVKKRWKEDTPQRMTELIDILRGIDDFSSKNTEDIVLGWITKNGFHMGNVMNAFRLTVVGECKGPHMFDITELLGKEETIARIKRGIAEIKPVA